MAIGLRCDATPYAHILALLDKQIAGRLVRLPRLPKARTMRPISGSFSRSSRYSLPRPCFRLLISTHPSSLNFWRDLNTGAL